MYSPANPRASDAEALNIHTFNTIPAENIVPLQHIFLTYEAISVQITEAACAAGAVAPAIRRIRSFTQTSTLACTTGKEICTNYVPVFSVDRATISSGHLLF